MAWRLRTGMVPEMMGTVVVACRLRNPAQAATCPSSSRDADYRVPPAWLPLMRAGRDRSACGAFPGPRGSGVVQASTVKGSYRDPGVTRPLS
jgi:hypothetical protein